MTTHKDRMEAAGALMDELVDRLAALDGAMSDEEIVMLHQLADTARGAVRDGRVSEMFHLFDGGKPQPKNWFITVRTGKVWQTRLAYTADAALEYAQERDGALLSIVEASPAAAAAWMEPGAEEEEEE